jgi:hypothetical protein
MDIFDSPWLINMLAKSSKTPQGRLLGLFDILNDWLKAPNFEQASVTLGAPNPLLISYCIEQAKSLGAENPEILAEHIVLIAQNAARHAIAQPESNSLIHAKKVALALIQAQTQETAVATGIRSSRSALYGVAASMVIVIGVAVIWAPMFMHSKTAQAQLAQQDQTNNTINQNKALTAIDASRMYAKYEQMRQGTCQFPEVLQIPDDHKSIYLENVVGGKLPNDLADLAVANFYLEKVRCNFTPMLMAASK